MKKLLVIVMHFIDPNYFTEMSYAKLRKWGIKDVCNGKIYFN